MAIRQSGNRKKKKNWRKKTFSEKGSKEKMLKGRNRKREVGEIEISKTKTNKEWKKIEQGIIKRIMIR